MAKRIAQKIQKPQKVKGSNWGFYTVGVLLVAAALLAWYVLHLWKHQKEEERAEAAIYSAFGITIPTSYYINGIDVSSHQNSIAWKKVATMKVGNVRMGFVFIKSTEGLGNTDENFTRNYANAKKAGMVCGAYHFFLATKSGAAQAANYLKNTPLTNGDFPPVVDIEQLYGVPPFQMRKRLKEWLDAVEAKYNTKPIIYSNADFYDNYLGTEFNNYPLWVAHYEEQDKPRISRDWIIWQHNEGGHVNGITTKVDCNVFNGDSTVFRQFLLGGKEQ